MSILIKGMEMPTSCAFCPMFDDVYTHFGDEEVYVCKLGVNLNYYQYAGNEPKDCPLVPVPPHGDLIDRDALPTSRVEWEDIVNAPTIIPAEDETDFYTKGHLHLGYAEEGE